MSQAFDRKRFWLVLGVLVLAESAALVFVRRPRTVPEGECSGVYQCYAHREGMEASFVRGFPINDTLKVDVTLLHAADGAGWDTLLCAFHIPAAVVEMAEEDPESELFEWQSPRGRPETRAITKGPNRDPALTKDSLELCVCSFAERQIVVYHTRNAKEVSAVRGYDFEKMI